MSETYKQAYRRAYEEDRLNEQMQKEAEEAHRAAQEAARRRQNESYPDRGMPMNPAFPGIPGMIGGRHDVDPFAPNPLAMPGQSNPMVPRGGPIYGPDGELYPRPGFGGGLGSDDDVYTQPGFGRGRGRPGHGRGNPFGNPFGGGGGFM